jgi:hypothetical protein
MELEAKVVGHCTVPDDRRLVLDAVSLEGGSFRGRDLEQFVAIKSRFIACDFADMKITHTCFGGGGSPSSYVQCVFDGSEITAVAPGFARFERCTFRDVHFVELNCLNVEFVDCTFSGAIDKGFFNGAVAANAVVALQRDRNEFRGNDFSAVEPLGADFRTGIDLRQQKLPVGTEYLYAEDGAALLEQLRALPDGSLGVGAEKQRRVLMQMMEMKVARGQRQLFSYIEGFPRDFRPVLRSIRELLLSGH